jgi:hypothetical protein
VTQVHGRGLVIPGVAFARDPKKKVTLGDLVGDSQLADGSFVLELPISMLKPHVSSSTVRAYGSGGEDPPTQCSVQTGGHPTNPEYHELAAGARDAAQSSHETARDDEDEGDVPSNTGDLDQDGHELTQEDVEMIRAAAQTSLEDSSAALDDLLGKGVMSVS